MSCCPCCTSARTEPLYVARGHAYVACTACGSARLDPPPADEPADLYGTGYFVGGEDRGGYVDYEADEAIHRRNATARLRLIASALPGRGRDAVDVGCASGYVLDAYRDAGFIARGVDVSPWARERAGTHGHDVHATLKGALAASSHLRVVSFFQVLEHLADPDEALGEAAAALGPGGLIVVETWDVGSRVARLSGARWQQANPPSVHHLFTRNGLRELADRHGLRVERLAATSKLVSPALAVGVVVHRLPRVGGPLLRGVQRSGLGRMAVPYKLGDLVTLVAVKR